MGRLLAFLGALAVIGLLLFNSFDPIQVERRQQTAQLEAERAQLELERQRHELERAQRLADATEAAQMGAGNAFWLLAVGAGVLILLGASDFYRQRRRPVVYPNTSGFLPVDRRLITQGDQQLIDLLATAIRARGESWLLHEIHQPGQLPHVYSPHYAYRNDQMGLPQPDVPLLPGGVPTFGELLAQGRVGRGNPLLLGFDVESGQELTGSWLDLYSTIVAGLPGSGKTTSQRFWACQVALFGARFAICDPHAGAADDSLAATLAPLSSSFLCEPASSDKAILDVVRLVADIGERRVSGRDHDTTPIILWLDETTALLGRSSLAPQLRALIERIAQEYRKRWVFCCASGQIWTAERTSSELRDSFASVLCHRMKRAQARLLLPTDEAERVERLETGRAVLWRASGVTQVIQIPNTTAQDCTHVAGLLATPRHTDMPESSQNVAEHMPEDMPMGSQGVAYNDLATSASGRGSVASAEARRAADMFLGGMDPSAIVWELRQVRSSEGKRYQTTLAEVLGLIRQGVRGAA